jgi:hypothetical protein
MKISCETARDLIPLYIEGIASSDSAALVEAHIATCEECRKKLEEMREGCAVPMDTDAVPLRKIQAGLRKRKILTIVASVMLSLTFAAIVIGYLSSPIYIPYSDGSIQVSEKADGSVLVLVENPSATGVDIYSIAGESGTVYHMTAWYSLWDKYVTHELAGAITVNADGKEISSLYYYNADGSEDILIYGTDQNPGGGVITLPRLVLNYYVWLTIILIIVCGIILLILLMLRKNKKARGVVLNILLVPIAYLIAHLCVKGFSGATYSATHDFLTIVLAAIPLYIALLLGVRLLSKNKQHA